VHAIVKMGDPFSFHSVRRCPLSRAPVFRLNAPGWRSFKIRAWGAIRLFR
jgi:hypothetical protein